MRRATLLLLPILVVASMTPAPAVAQRRDAAPVLHEPIPPDPREDVALSVSLAGDLPAAIQTPHGVIPAPDPAKPVGAGESPYGPGARNDVPGNSFNPDRNTKRPDVLPYDDPFSPSTAPFKRLSVFDNVDASYTLSVQNPTQLGVEVAPTPLPDASEEQFYADMVVDLVAGQRVRIPSVAPGERVLRARAGVGTEDVRFSLYRDYAENWFIEGARTTKARVVMELSAPRAAFGGDFGNPTWAELLPPPPRLPKNVDDAAAIVSQRIGVSTRMSPRDDVAKLVTYFRGFQDSDESPAASRDIYLDLALSKKGVCRHRAFAFLVTALHLGIKTRMVVNEAHAWVEVYDGSLWRRIDLGGAGQTLHDPLSQNVPFEPPPDPFSWPPGSTRGEELADRARHEQTGGPPGGRASQSNATRPAAASPSASGSASFLDPNAPPGEGEGDGNGGGAGGLRSAPGGKSGVPDERPPSQVTMALAQQTNDAHRGAPFHIRGQVAADGEVCGHVSVQIVLRSRGKPDIPVGVLATDERGAYDGALVLPSSVPLGDWDVVALTLGDARCGRGITR